MPNLQNITSPVLIIGPGRSGSSWVLHVLQQHPDVQSLIENQILEVLYHEIFHSPWAPTWHFICDDQEVRARAVRTVRHALCELFPSDRSQWAMKAISRGRPFDFIREVFPDARYIHLTRSPTTAVPSMTEFFGAKWTPWQRLDYSENEFVAAHREALQFRDVGVPYLRVRQEDMGAEPKKVWAAITQFCGLPPVDVPGLVQVINPANSTSSKRRKSRPPLAWTHFSPEALAISRELGYLPEIEDASPVKALAAALESQIEQLTLRCTQLEADKAALSAERDRMHLVIANMLAPAQRLIDRDGDPTELRRALAEVHTAGQEYVSQLAGRREAPIEPAEIAPDSVASDPATIAQKQSGAGPVRIERVELLNDAGQPARTFRLFEPITLEVVVRSPVPVDHPCISFLVYDDNGQHVMGTTTFDEHTDLPALPVEQPIATRFTFQNALRPWTFGIAVAATRVTKPDYSDAQLFTRLDGCAAFTVLRDPERPVHYTFHQPVSVTWRQL